jgi:FkbM family methyltransferase
MRAGLTSLVAATARRLPLRARLFFYRLGPLTGWMRRTLNRAVPTGIQPVRIAAGELAGSWLVLDLQVDKDLWLGNYEPDAAQAVRRFAPTGGVAYDLGANVGYTTLLLARAVGRGGRVFAFEPLPDNLQRLRHAVRLNGLESQVIVVPTAVGAQHGPATFRVHASGGMGRLADGAGREKGFVAETAVEVLTLDEFVFGQHQAAPDLIKIDLEGGEGAALRGMARLLREHRPCLLIELHGSQAAAEAWSELETAGYRLHRMEPGYPEVVSYEPARLPSHVVARAPERAD